MIWTVLRRVRGKVVSWLLARITTDPGVGWRPSRKRNDLHFK